MCLRHNSELDPYARLEKRKVDRPRKAVVLSSAVLGPTCPWLIERTMTDIPTNANPEVADVLVYVDEAGDRGLVRNLTPADDDKISVIAALPVPAAMRAAASQLIAPLYARFVAGMPPDAKPHITDAFAPGREAWATIAREVRSDLEGIFRRNGFVIVYAARRFGVARQSFIHFQSVKANAKASASDRYKVSRGNRPSDDRVEDVLVSTLGLLMEEFAAQENHQRVDLMFDEIDASVAARHAADLNRIRTISRLSRTVSGWDTVEQKRVEGRIDFEALADFELDTRRLGQIDVIGKRDPLVFAADVVANGLWRHLKSLDVDAALNATTSLEGWSLGDRVWGAGRASSLDRF